MYTRSTKNFGIWRDFHSSKRRLAGNPTSWFVLALGISTFICGLLFFLILIIKHEFFLIESSNLKLITVPSVFSKVFSEKYPSLTIAVIPEAKTKENFWIVFDNGEKVLFPQETEKLKQLAKKRSDFIELFGMLAMKIPLGTGRLQIWPEESVNWAHLQKLIKIFSDLGFDDFDIAVKVSEQKT